MQDIIAELKKRLTKAVRKNRTGGILLSGGLDSAILAYLCPELRAITVSLGSTAADLKYAKLTAKLLKLKHCRLHLSAKLALQAIPEAIKILGSFDPALPNDLVVYFGLQQAKTLGINTVITGDGSDELFGGYSFMQRLDDLQGYIKRIARSMQFSSNRLGKYFKIKIVQPFLDKHVVDFALKIKPELKIKRQGGRTWGKWILRQAFRGYLPDAIIWQDKRPLEYGSGMSRLRGIISSKIKDRELKDHPDAIKFITRDHLYYYRIYQQVVGAIPPAKKGHRRCPGCRTGITRGAFHCYLCGWAKPI
ncbi:MAG: hypothetical protein HQ595_04725 [Candidatus Omnitrophica bacterium]|nr:hypothetical protein [Candidatus Omnitrophota bacterium]